jgi:hypothetical protein
MQGRKTCARRREKQAMDRAQWGQGKFPLYNLQVIYMEIESRSNNMELKMRC